MGIIKTGRIQTMGDPIGDLYVKAIWFEQIDSGTSGTLTIPAQGEIVLDQWAAGIDALASTISSGIPAFISPTTAGGVIITATLDSNGNWTLSGTPSAYPVAVIYVYKVKFRYFDSTYQIGGYELIPSADGVFTDTTDFNGILSSADNDIQKALDTIDNHAHIWAQINKTVSDIGDITTKSHTSLSDIGTNTHTQIDSHLSSTSNPHSVTKIQVGLSDVTNDAQIPLSQKAAANGVASLDASSKVVQDPVNATATPTASKIPIADGSGKLDGWITASGEDVTAAINLTDNALVRGDGGAKGVQTSTILVDDSGRMTNPNQPAFLAKITSQITNVTGDDTIYDIIGAVWTEIFDQGNNFLNGTFTAPITGKYLLGGVIGYQGITSAHTYANAKITTSNRDYYFVGINVYSVSYNGAAYFSFSFPVDMDINDTVYITVTVFNGTKVIDISIWTYFGGMLIC